MNKEQKDKIFAGVQIILDAIKAEESAMAIIKDELEMSSSNFSAIIVHPKLMDSLIEEVKRKNMQHTLVRESNPAGYIYMGLTVYVSSENMNFHQVIVI